MRALMQDLPLTVDRLLDHAARWHSGREIVTRDHEGRMSRTTYADLHREAKRVSNALARAGVKQGDRIATLAWNSDRHLSAWYGIVGMGAICHTINPRLFMEQIGYIANHAEDRILFTDPNCADIVEELLPQAPSIEKIIFFCAPADMPKTSFDAISFDDWIAGESDEFEWGGFDEKQACGLCYTSGTTGNPKGVLYGHRSNYLHALMTLQADALGISARDTLLPIVPMYHANAWGLVYSAPAAGAKLVLPGRHLDPKSIYDLMEAEQVTYANAVPTIWQTLLQYVKENGLKFSALKKVTVGGAACPEVIIRTFRDEHGVDVIQGWGMTETSPLATIAMPNAHIAQLSPDEQMPWKLKQGRLICGIDLKLVDDAGNRLPHDGKTPGNVMIKGDTIASSYYGGTHNDALDAEGYFDTGDIATIDAHGFLQITDRAKDVIKSGGEWISSIDVENIVVGHPKVELAAVIGIAHPKWDERPLLLVKLRPGESAGPQEFRDYLEGRIANWWLPDETLIVDDIPLGPTGKIDKKELRNQLADFQMSGVGTPAQRDI